MDVGIGVIRFEEDCLPELLDSRDDLALGIAALANITNRFGARGLEF